ncbi:MAG: hypothetical protein ACOVOT_05600 [Rubrivivax sp.]
MPIFRSSSSKAVSRSKPPLRPVSDFQRTVADTARGEDSTTRLTSLNPSVLEDLRRFETGRRAIDALEVLAAAVRHGRNLLLHVKLDDQVLPLTVFAIERLVHTPLPMSRLLAGPLVTWHVMNVEPARLQLAAPGVKPLLASDPPPADTIAVAPAHELAALGPLLWELALRGSRTSLLPEIAGTMAYRIAPGADLGTLEVSGHASRAVQRLRKQTANLRDVASWPGFDHESASRLLNGLYLQAALVLSRSHPAATNDMWDGGQKH